MVSPCFLPIWSPFNSPVAAMGHAPRRLRRGGRAVARPRGAAGGGTAGEQAAESPGRGGKPEELGILMVDFMGFYR